MTLAGSDATFDELVLPDNLLLPMESIEHVEVMDNALSDSDFRRRLVRLLLVAWSFKWCFVIFT
jgi:hypothetical protein